MIELCIGVAAVALVALVLLTGQVQNNNDLRDALDVREAQLRERDAQVHRLRTQNEELHKALAAQIKDDNERTLFIRGAA